MRLLDVFKMIATVHPYRGTYGPWLIAVSVLIMVLATSAGLSTSSQMVSASAGRSRWAQAMTAFVAALAPIGSAPGRQSERARALEGDGLSDLIEDRHVAA